MTVTKKSTFALVLGLHVLSQAYASEIINGEDVFDFTSPRGVSEKCISTSRLDDGKYSKKDIKKEEEFCKIDLYNDSNIGVCPKTWSTSPGTIVYDLSKSDYKNQKEKFEKEVCGTRATRSYKSIAKFKNSMNQQGTSGTYSASNIIYYHMSRLLDTSIEVPVAVYREIDSQEHLKRAKLGLSSSPAGMIKNGWQWTINAILNPSVYRPTSDLFTDDQDKVYGVMLKDSGERYGAEINGIRSEWGLQSSVDFSKTPAFMALTSKLKISEAISYTLREYHDYLKSETKKHSGGLFKKKNLQALENLSHLKASLPFISSEQMAVWMKDLSEIVILDTILGQQDRIGNIDYKWYAYSVSESGELVDVKLDSELPLTKIKSLYASNEVTSLGQNVVLIQKTKMGDNDAGVRVNYVNFSKNAKLIESINHLSDKTYEAVKILATDLSNGGQISENLRSAYGLKESEIAQIASNTSYVFDVLKKKCLEKTLKFDLNPKEFIKTKTVGEKSVSCE